ncbi:MAG: aldehyde ferredoxin oxidoreductase, partial [Desulfobacula sp.]|nr:aldehyde ferredoxin oxidoreductase [Desulfobacula sp.]
MKYGFMDKILRVNLTSRTTAIEKIPEQWAKDYLGGAGLATKYLFEEVPADTDPLGPDNKLIFMTGPLTGTSSASASRYSVVAKSPLTGLWGHGNSGGSFGPAMKRAGFDGFIIEGSSAVPVYLEILDGDVKLLPAKNLWGKTVPETEDILEEMSDHKVTIASIGPGGENLVRYAAIMNNKHRAVGRTGMGAVMGSKKLKAIVCAGKIKFEIADPDGFKITARRQIDFLDESMLKVGFEAFGTNMVSDMVNARGGYPTRNWQTGVFDDIEEVNSEALTNKVL